MAKKSKNASLAKKRKAKEIARKKKISKVGGVKMRRKTMSMSRLKKNLVNIPVLLFEPEMMEIAPTKASAEILSHSENELERLDFFFDSDMNQKLNDSLDTLKNRLNPKNDRMKLMNVQAIIHFMETQSVTYLNQLAIGLYFRAISENGEFPFDENTVIEFMTEFENKHADEIEKIMGESGDMADGDESEDEDSAGLLLDDEPEILSEFRNFLNEKTELDDDTRDNFSENIEVFLNDFIMDEKKVADFTQIQAKHFRLFYEFHFPQNMNPTDEDKTQMKASLDQFADFLMEKKILNTSQAEEAKDLSS